MLLVSTRSFAATPNPPNVTASQFVPIVVTGGTVSADFPTTDMKVSLSGLEGGLGTVDVTTQTLSSPSTGVLAASSSSNDLYFDVNITLPAGVPAPSNAIAVVSMSNPSITPEATLEYWAGSSWAATLGSNVNGTTITGTFPISGLLGTNVAVVEPATASSTSASLLTYPSTTINTTTPGASMSSTSVAILGAVIIVIVIAVGFMVMRGRGKAKSAP